MLTLFYACSLADVIGQVLNLTHVKAAEGFYYRTKNPKLPSDDTTEKTVRPILSYGGNWC